MAKFRIEQSKVNAKSVNRTIRMKEETFDKLMKLSSENHTSFNKVVLECIEYALKHM